MRSLLAGVAVVLAFLTGTVALGAHVVHDVVLDPARAGQVVDYALHQPDTRREVLARVVPGYGRLPVGVRARVDALADAPRLREAARTVALDDRGEVSLGPLQRALAARLRVAGQPGIAALVAAADSRVSVPRRYADRYRTARADSRNVAVRGAVATTVLVLLALLASSRRRRTLRSVGVAALLAALVVGLLYWALPSAIAAASSSPLVGAAVAVVVAERSTVLIQLAPVAVAGLMLVVAGLAVRPRRVDG